MAERITATEVIQRNKEAAKNWFYRVGTFCHRRGTRRMLHGLDVRARERNGQ